MKSDPDFNIRFVQLVESRPELYNFDCPGYLNKVETDRAWSEIAKELNETVQACISKWRVLRGGFNRAIKCTRKPYYLMEHMQFIKPFFKRNERKINTEESDASLSDDSMPLCIVQSNESEHFEEEDDADHAEMKPEIPTTKRKIKTDEEDELFIELIPSKKLNREEEERLETEADSNFLKSLLPDMSKLSHSHKRQFKMTILKSLNELLDE